MSETGTPTKGVSTSIHRNRELFDAYYSGWDRASLGLPPDPPKANGFNMPDPELGDYHRMVHAAHVLAGEVADG